MSKPITEFVGLRSKMYSIKTESKKIKKAKGINKSVVRTNTRHCNFVDTLFDSRRSYLFIYLFSFTPPKREKNSA
jgi:hypothetical protein